MARKDPQIDDVVLNPCHYCGKLIVLARPEHRCKKLVEEKEYVSKVARAQLLWTEEHGWQLLWWPEGIWVEDIRVIDVFNWINDKLAQFEPVLPKEIEDEED